jgi:type IV secretion system protein VirD4
VSARAAAEMRKSKRVRKPGRIAVRRQQVARAAARAAWKPAAVAIAAAAEAAHIGIPLYVADLHMPYGWIAAGGVLALSGRDGYDSLQERRSGGKRAARARRKYQGTATGREVTRSLSPRAARRRTAGVHAEPVTIGSARGRVIAGSAEDTYLLAAPPRSGKSALLACWIADAPGTVLATSTRADLYAHTAIPRGGRGLIWVLNPDGDGGIPSTLSWSPVGGCESPAVAMQRAGYLMDAAPKDSSGRDAWWDHQSKTLLQYLLHAAALVDGSIWDVRRWASGVLADPVPLNALATHTGAAAGWGAEMAAMAERIAVDDNYGGAVCSGVMTSLAWLSDPAMADAACPVPGEGFDAEAFLREGTGTIYLIGADKPHGALAPYFAAFAAHLFETAKRIASSSPGMRLPDPFTLALDEAAITCPVPLHKWMSEAGGHGITVMAAIQALSQLRSRWGAEDGRTIFTNSTVKVIFGGFTDHEDLEAVSAVCGQRDTWDHVKGPGGSKTRAMRQERAIPPERIRMLGKFEALVLHRSTRPVFATVTPVWERRGYQRAEPVQWAPQPEPEPLVIEPPRVFAVSASGPPEIKE